MSLPTRCSLSCANEQKTHDGLCSSECQQTNPVIGRVHSEHLRSATNKPSYRLCSYWMWLLRCATNKPSYKLYLYWMWLRRSVHNIKSTSWSCATNKPMTGYIVLNVTSALGPQHKKYLVRGTTSYIHGDVWCYFCCCYYYCYYYYCY